MTVLLSVSVNNSNNNSNNTSSDGGGQLGPVSTMVIIIGVFGATIFFFVISNWLVMIHSHHHPGILGKIAQLCTTRPAKLNFKLFEKIDQASRKITNKKKTQVVPFNVGGSAEVGKGGKGTTQKEKKVNPKNLRNWALE